MECGGSSCRHSSSYPSSSGKSLADTKQDPLVLCWFVCLSIFFSLFLPQPQTRLHYLFQPVIIQRFSAPCTWYYLRSCERGAENPRGTLRVAASSKERERTKSL